MKSLHTLLSATFIALAGLFSVPAIAQQTTTSQQTQVYSQAELDQMLAPIALYPDTVLSHVLIAATYPLEIVQAARWSRNNPGISGQDAVDRVENQDWDPSVKALVAFPELLERMDQDLAWTQGIGDAFLAQEGEVTDTIQYLRNQAYDNGQLQSNQQVNVVRETRYIYIEPAQPQVVYVPYYDPRVVYGSWRWAAYPPVYWHHPPGFSVGLGWYWGAGFHIQSSFFFSSFYWPSRHVVVVDHHYHDYYRNYGYKKGHGGYRPGHHMAHYDGARRWQHNSDHRRGVNYRGDVSRDRFSQHDGGRGRDQGGPDRNVRTRGEQRDWADQRRSQFADNDGNFQRGDRSRGPGSEDRGRGQNRPGNGDGSADRGDRGAQGNPGDQVAGNTARDGRQQGPRDGTGRRPAPLDGAGENAVRNGRDRTGGPAQRSTERNTDRTIEQDYARNTDQAIERLRRDLDNSGASRRPGQQGAESRSTDRDTARNTQGAKPGRSNRSVLPAADSQPSVAWRGQDSNPARASRGGSENGDRRVDSQARDSSAQRVPRNFAAAPQRSQNPAAPSRQAEPRRQAQPQYQAPPAREAAPAYHARVDRAAVERAARPERAVQSQGSEPRQSSGKGERSSQGGGQGGGQSGGPRGRERNSRD